jgi:hypothetical protein
VNWLVVNPWSLMTLSLRSLEISVAFGTVSFFTADGEVTGLSASTRR